MKEPLYDRPRRLVRIPHDGLAGVNLATGVDFRRSVGRAAGHAATGVTAAIAAAAWYCLIVLLWA